MSDVEKIKEIDPKNKKTILIFGLTSMVGSNLAEFFSKDFRVVGTYYRKPISLPGVLALPCNVLNKDEVQLVLYAFKPDFVIYCVGFTGLKDCNDNPNISDALNSGGLFNVAEMAPRYGARVIYLSSQYVFAGDNRAFNEMDNPDVTTQYGKSQASSEFYLQKSSLNYLIVRCCRLYGRGISPIRDSFFEAMQKKIKNNQSAIYDDFVHTGFIDVYYLAMVLKICFERNISNRVLQFSTQDIMTNYEFAKTYAEIFGESDGLINKGKWFFPILKTVTLNRSSEHHYFKMDILNIEGVLRLKLPTVRESLLFTYKRFKGVDKTKASSTKKGEGISFI